MSLGQRCDLIIDLIEEALSDMDVKPARADAPDERAHRVLFAELSEGQTVPAA